MAIPYQSPGAQLTAVEWNAIFQAADALLTTALGGMSAVVSQISYTGPHAAPVYADRQWDRCFFFFDPTSPPTNLHPVFEAYTGASYGPPNQPSMFFRLYSDTTVATALSGLTVSSTSAKYGAAIVGLPTWSAWSGTVYPSGFGSQPTTGLYYGTTPAVNILDVSLKVCTVTVSGTPYNITFQDVTTAEHAQPYKPIDIFINANFTWLTAWNKYEIVRLHNCGCASVTVSFPGASFTLAAGASRCVRMISSTAWAAQGNYFHWMLSGDPRFISCQEAVALLAQGGFSNSTTELGNYAQISNGATCSINQPGIVLDILWAVLICGLADGNFSSQFNAAKFWDLSPIYNNPNYVPTAVEKKPPTGGYLPALSTAACIGDLIVPKGKVIVANRLLAPTQAVINFTGFGSGWATLTAALTAAGVSSRAIASTNLELYYSNGTNRQDLIDLSTSLVSLITQGQYGAFCGATQTSSPKSLVLPTITIQTDSLSSTPTTTNYTYYTWATDGSGNPYKNTLITLAVQNAGASADPDVTEQTFTLDQPVSDIVTYISATALTGGVVTNQNFRVLSTTFGPILMWDEIWPLSAAIGGLPTGAGEADDSYIASVTLQTGGNPALVVTRYLTLAANLGIWPGLGTTTAGSITGPLSQYWMFWNFPRVDQQIGFNRSFLHPSGDSPMMPSWYGSGTQYANIKYNTLTPGESDLMGVGDPPLYWDWLSTELFGPIKSFYETTPITEDSPLGYSSDRVAVMAGFSRMGPFSSAGTYWTLFAAWYNNKGTFVYPIQPDLGPTAGIDVPNTGVDSTDWYSNNPSTIIPTPAAAAPNLVNGAAPWFNLLPCQVEHYNTLAGLINSFPPMVAPLNNTTAAPFTLNFAAANILIASGGANYQVNDTIVVSGAGATSVSLKVTGITTIGSVGGIVTSLADDGTAYTGTFTVPGPLRPFVCTGGHGSGLLVDSASGSGGSPLFIPTYNQFGVPNNDGSQGTMWPRTAYFAWNGPTSGGADPIATYLTALATAAGVSLTVQTALPDGYGTPIVNQFQGGPTPPLGPLIDDFILIWNYASGLNSNGPGPVFNQPGTSYTGPFQDYNPSYSPIFQLVAGAYRWINISDARALYAALGLPFVLNTIAVPMTFTVQNGYTFSGTAAVSPAFGACTTMVGWYNDEAGNWLAAPTSMVLRRDINPPDTYVPPIYVTDGTNPGTVTLQPGPLLGQINTFGVPAAYTSLVWLLEGMPTQQLVARIGQNYAYADPLWVGQNTATFIALGTGVIPWVVDNGAEGRQPGLTILSGVGGASTYDNVITTDQGNVRVITLPLDAVLNATTTSTGAGGKSGVNPNVGAGNTGGANAGGAGSAGGGL